MIPSNCCTVELGEKNRNGQEGARGAAHLSSGLNNIDVPFRIRPVGSEQTREHIHRQVPLSVFQGSRTKTAFLEATSRYDVSIPIPP